MVIKINEINENNKTRQHKEVRIMRNLLINNYGNKNNKCDNRRRRRGNNYFKILKSDNCDRRKENKLGAHFRFGPIPKVKTNNNNNNNNLNKMKKFILNQYCYSSIIFMITIIYLQPSEAFLINNNNNNNQQQNSSTIIIDHHHHQHNHNQQQQQQQQYFNGGQLLPTSAAGLNQQQQQQHQIGHHYQPAFVYGARNRSVNFTHLLLDELTGSIYIGATNWLFQLSASNLKADFALKTGPSQQQENSKDCSPADCLTQLAHIDGHSLQQLMHHSQGTSDFSIPSQQQHQQSSSLLTTRKLHLANGIGNTMHTSGNSSFAFLAPPRSTTTTTTITTNAKLTTNVGGSQSAMSAAAAAAVTQNQLHNNNYNKILVLDSESKQLIVCGSLSQGACRRHQLGQIGNFSDLIPVPVASNDELSSSVALVVSPSASPSPSPSNVNNNNFQKPIMYVAATNSRLGPYREQVPAISARYLDPPQKAMQIIEKSFTDSARIDISFELRDYYLVNYVHTFQHNDYIYFATIQRRSPLRQFEELGYITRLARLCLNDLSFQSYTEITLECRSQQQQQQQQQNIRKRNFNLNKQDVNYNLLQDAYLTQASSQLAQQFGIKSQSSILIGSFAQSKDHSTKSQLKSAICIFPMEKIEFKFNENIHLCYNGSSKARNMNYIAGSVNDCPKVGKAGNIANFCSEPLKLNGSLPMLAQPVITFDDQLITAIAGTQAPTSPLIRSSNQQQPGNHYNQRQHQVLIAGTSEGLIKRIVLVSDNNNYNYNYNGIRGLEFDSVQIGDKKATFSDNHNEQNEPILADLHLMPTINPQISSPSPSSSSSSEINRNEQFAILGTSHKIVKLRINSCKADASLLQLKNNNNNKTTNFDECLACSQLQDPFCGWCATTGSCLSREECDSKSSIITNNQLIVNNNNNNNVHWTPFDQIKCSDYQLIYPKFIPIQQNLNQFLDVNIKINQNQNRLNNNQHKLFAQQLTQAQFICHFDYLTYLKNRTQVPNISGATTKALQAKLNLHNSIVVISCPLPAYSQRPTTIKQDLIKVKLSVRLINNNFINNNNNNNNNEQQYENLKQFLGMKRSSLLMNVKEFDNYDNNNNNNNDIDQVEREFSLYDCSQYTSCSSCLSTSTSSPQVRNSSLISNSNKLNGFNCQWCPLSNKCTFNSSHPDLGCTASAIISTTPHSTSPANNLVRASHLTSSLDQAQANVYSISYSHLSQCPASELLSTEVVAASSSSSSSSSASALEPTTIAGAAFIGASGLQQQQQQETNQNGGKSNSLTSSSASSSGNNNNNKELLIPNNSRQSIRVLVKAESQQQQQQQHKKRLINFKYECLLDFEGAKMRLPAKLIDGEIDGSNQVIICQEQLFSYQEEIATLRAQLNVIQISVNNQVEQSFLVIDSLDVILYKCHLFGVNPPALTSTIGVGHLQHSPIAGHQYSTVAWKFNDLLSSSSSSFNYGNEFANSNSIKRRRHILSNNNISYNNNSNQLISSHSIASDCSLCLNVERKYQCVWCNNQCQYSNQCTELAAPTCPPPRIISIHPTSGPLEGGTLITIEGSNLGSNEREIQEKISVGGEPCQLYMYSVSTRIVCKTGPSLHGAQAATVYVGNRIGVTSAHEKFHYKAVHLTDVNPRIGPISGGTRLFLTGSNLNIGSRIQIFLDDIPCTLDSQSDISNHQISCITGPNLQANSMRITRLTLMIDNSTHFLPYPFTYQPDPILTSIEPAESFQSGGRLILIYGQYLASPQTTKLIVYHEHKHNIINGTNCITQNDTLITCLTPAISRDLIDSLQQQHQLTNNNNNNENFISEYSMNNSNSLLSYENGGLKLKISLIMDDVKSVRNLDEYYHHLPHYITYFEDPQLFRLTKQIVDYNNDINNDGELIIYGENLQMKQLDQDILITIGSSNVCSIKLIKSNQIICELPKKVLPIYDENGHLIDKAQLQIVALIGSNLRFQIGYIQYNSQQYQTIQPATTSLVNNNNNNNNNYSPGLFSNVNSIFSKSSITNLNDFNQFKSDQLKQNFNPTSTSFIILLTIIFIVIILTIGFVLVFALSRFKKTKAEREYRRIQLQMGSLDINGQPILGAGNIFDTIHITNSNNNGINYHQNQHVNNGSSVTSRALDYVGSALSKKKLFYQFNNNNNNNKNININNQNSPFPPSPLTDISSLTGTNPLVHNQHQHIIKLSSDGTIINSINGTSYSSSINNNNNNNLNHHLYNSGTNSNNSSQSSPNNSTRNGNFEQQHRQQQQFILQQNNNQSISDKSNLLLNGHHQQQQQQQQQQQLIQTSNGNSQRRNFNWTQEAPSTIVPYSVIEACNLTLEGKNAIKEFV